MSGSGSLPIHDLPIFRLDKTERSLFYTPGYIVVVDAAQTDAFESDLCSTPSGAELMRCAAEMEVKWRALISRPFTPVCLTLYLNNSCNLNCKYCYASTCPSHSASPKLDLEVIRAAAEVVAANCAAQGRQFIVAFHGGGEPTLDQSHVETALDVVAQAAGEFNLRLFRYIATNGVMSGRKAKWLTERFDEIGLSCDGPADIQACQRPLHNGNGSTSYVERTARIVRESGKALVVRATITPQSFTRQAEIAEYLCKELKPREIHVEPVYLGGRTADGNVFSVEQAEAYVDEFFKARWVAGQYGIPWLTSGSRPTEIHGPYCNHIRNVVTLTPFGQATACFKSITPDELSDQGVNIGWLNKTSGRFMFDDARIRSLRRRLGNDPPRCKTCLNRYHCVRGCPDHCVLGDPANAPLAEFRCRIQKLMMDKYLWEQVEHVSPENSGGIVGKKLPFMAS